MKITIIGGGNIGGAIAGGLAASTLMKASDLTVADPSAAALERIKGLNSAIRTSQDNAAAVEGADLIILAVKPWLAEEVSATFRDKLNFDRQCLASVVAGVSFEKLKTMLDNGKDVRPALLRLIPNTAILAARERHVHRIGRRFGKPAECRGHAVQRTRTDRSGIGSDDGGRHFAGVVRNRFRAEIPRRLDQRRRRTGLRRKPSPRRDRHADDARRARPAAKPTARCRKPRSTR